MARVTQRQISHFDLLSNEVLQLILDFAMLQNSPLYLNDPYRGTLREWRSDKGQPIRLLEDSLHDVQDHIPLHERALQSVHLNDWIFINSTSRRIRALGKVSFFRYKTMAMDLKLLLQLQQDDFTGIQRDNSTEIKYMEPNDQMLARSCICDIIIVDAAYFHNDEFILLPQRMAVFPKLRRCTLLSNSLTRQKHMEWIIAAFVSSRGSPLETRELMYDIGMPKEIQLDEAMWVDKGWSKDWFGDNRNFYQMIRELYVYPSMRAHIELLQDKQKKLLGES